MRKRLLIILTVSVLLSITSFLLGNRCRWNPVEGSVVPPGICRNPVIFLFFALPYMFAPALADLLLGFVGINASGAVIISLGFMFSVLVYYIFITAIVALEYGEIPFRGNFA